MFAQYKDGVVVAAFGCAQPDAVNEAGEVICKGVDTVELPDDHPDVIAFYDALKKSTPATL